MGRRSYDVRTERGQVFRRHRRSLKTWEDILRKWSLKRMLVWTSFTFSFQWHSNLETIHQNQEASWETHATRVNSESCQINTTLTVFLYVMCYCYFGFGKLEKGQGGHRGRRSSPFTGEFQLLFAEKLLGWRGWKPTHNTKKTCLISPSNNCLCFDKSIISFINYLMVTLWKNYNYNQLKCQSMWNTKAIHFYNINRWMLEISAVLTDGVSVVSSQCWKRKVQRVTCCFDQRSWTPG